MEPEPKPTRPRIRYKHIKRRKPTLSQRQRALRLLHKTEKTHGITPDKVSMAILRHRGLITHVAKALKMDRMTLTRYIEKNELCLETLATARDAMGDVAEKKLYELIEAGDVRCILYYLSTVHRNRGYGINADSANSPAALNGPVFVETVNIVGIPSGTFLPKEIASQDNMVIENNPD